MMDLKSSKNHTCDMGNCEKLPIGVFVFSMRSVVYGQHMVLYMQICIATWLRMKAATLARGIGVDLQDASSDTHCAKK